MVQLDTGALQRLGDDDHRGDTGGVIPRTTIPAVMVRANHDWLLRVAIPEVADRVEARGVTLERRVECQRDGLRSLR